MILTNWKDTASQFDYVYMPVFPTFSFACMLRAYFIIEPKPPYAAEAAHAVWRAEAAEALSEAHAHVGAEPLSRPLLMPPMGAFALTGTFATAGGIAAPHPIGTV